jgi:hypothetical protein
MKKGSQIRAEILDKDLRNLAAEFVEKLETDPYQPGVIHPQVYPDDLQEVVEDLFYIRGYSESTIKIKRNKDGVSISVEVLDRTGNK